MNIAEDAKNAGIRSVSIVGDGEPTMNRGLYDFAKKLHAVGVDSAVATNGLLLTPPHIKDLTSSCTWLRFNVSAVNKYERVMGAPRGSFRKFENIVRYAVDHKGKCTIGLQMVLIPDCFDEVIPLACLAREWGVDYLVIKQFSDGGEGMPMHFDMNDYAKAEEKLRVAESLSCENTKIIVKWKAMQDAKSITMNKKWGFDRCIDLPFLFQISGDGGCYPCGYLFGEKEYCYGNVNNERLIDILKSDKYWNIIEKVKNTPLKDLCTGQCRHCESLKFMDKLTKIYKGSLQGALVDMAGGEDKYLDMLSNPPEHISFL
jgi:radical SAM protein with 4Fe4S-binding SPASM domain